MRRDPNPLREGVDDGTALFAPGEIHDALATGLSDRPVNTDASATNRERTVLGRVRRSGRKPRCPCRELASQSEKNSVSLVFAKRAGSDQRASP